MDVLDVLVKLGFLALGAILTTAGVTWRKRRLERWLAQGQYHQRPPTESVAQRYADANRNADAVLRDGETTGDTYRRQTLGRRWRR